MISFLFVFYSCSQSFCYLFISFFKKNLNIYGFPLGLLAANFEFAGNLK